MCLSINAHYTLYQICAHTALLAIFLCLFLLFSQDAAAAKIQSIQRKRSEQAAQSGTSGGSLEEVFNNFCATYRQVTVHA